MGNEQIFNSNVEDLVNQTISIMPHQLLNKKCLYTTQDWIDDQRKLRAALRHEDIPPTDMQPSAHLWLRRGKRRLVMTDGNHRTGIASLYHEEIDIGIQDVWESDVPPLKVFPFGLIVAKIRLEIAGIDGLYDLEP
jgi:hypothetical protein